MFRKIVAWLVLIYAVLVLAAVAPRLGTFTWQAPLALVSALVGLIGAIGLLRAWPHSHLMAGLFPLAIAGVTIWNALELHMLYGRIFFPGAYTTAAALLCLAFVIYDYRKTGSFEPEVGGAPVPMPSLWRKAPTWRNLVIGATALSAALVAMPWVLPPASERLPDAGCAAEGSLRPTTKGSTPAEITFVNRSGRAIRTYWLNYQGKRVYYTEIPPGKSFTQQTYFRHPWVITGSASGDCMAIFLPAQKPGVAMIE